MLPIALLKVAPLVLSLGIVAATLPNGDVERSLFRDVPGGVQALVEHETRTGDKRLERSLLPRGRYGWRIEEVRRTILMAVPGRPTGVVRQAYQLTAWVDATPNPLVEPHPVRAFSFYASSRKAAEKLRDRLNRALGATE